MSSKKLNILLTNDDGIKAAGLRVLWEGLGGEGLKDFADLTIIAPMVEQSGKGVSVTFYGPLRVESEDSYDNTPAWKVEGTPADCVKLALGGLLPTPPDLIVSGVNHGSNAGRGFFHSGTAGCIIQGTLQGIPGIAFSYSCHKTSDFSHVKPYIQPIVNYVANHPLPVGSFLNVNFPKKTIQGIKMARHGMAFWLDTVEKKELEEGHLEFHLQDQFSDHEEHPESDISLLKAGFVTAVPIHINDMTDQTHFKNYKDHFESQTNR